jgi:guanylate kinase
MTCVFVVSGPSGVGKGTLCKKLLTEYPQLGLQLSVSMTSRPPRPGEINGQHYHFVTPQQFQAAIDQGDMLEWAKYNQQFYGTPRQSVQHHLDAGLPVLLEIEPQGAFQVRHQFTHQAYLMFIQPPSEAVLLQRLHTRGTNTPQDIENRLTIARQEMAQLPLFDWHTVNDNLDTATRHMADAIANRLAKA